LSFAAGGNADWTTAGAVAGAEAPAVGPTEPLAEMSEALVASRFAMPVDSFPNPKYVSAILLTHARPSCADFQKSFADVSGLNGFAVAGTSVGVAGTAFDSAPFDTVFVTGVGAWIPLAAVVSDDAGTSLPGAAVFITTGTGTSAPVVCVTVVCCPDGDSAPFAAVLTETVGVVSAPFAWLNTENSGAAAPVETMFATGNAAS
jgi:hypothetical protein